MNRLIRWWHRTGLYAWWLCRTKQCCYFRHYLAYGPADLAHEGYHAAEEMCRQWQERASQYDARGVEPPRFVVMECEKWERRVRA